mmetsp:Transcript_7742/g.32024  ORF Transcript_7742/g.32024 Transcript_7742/m.32024 type:complete len:221 (-) Transcript_7742:19-681(-)
MRSSSRHPGGCYGGTPQHHSGGRVVGHGVPEGGALSRELAGGRVADEGRGLSRSRRRGGCRVGRILRRRHGRDVSGRVRLGDLVPVVGAGGRVGRPRSSGAAGLRLGALEVLLAGRAVPVDFRARAFEAPAETVAAGRGLLQVAVRADERHVIGRAARRDVPREDLELLARERVEEPHLGIHVGAPHELLGGGHASRCCWRPWLPRRGSSTCCRKKRVKT